MIFIIIIQIVADARLHSSKTAKKITLCVGITIQLLVGKQILYGHNSLPKSA